MRSLQKAQRPAATWRQESADLGGNQRVDSTNSGAALTRNFRDKLRPSPYYDEVLRSLGKPNLLGWAVSDCPFCGEYQSFNVQMSGARGGWHCESCEDRGDLIKFHQKRTGLKFKPAVRDLLHRAKLQRNREEVTKLTSLYKGGVHGR